MAQPVIIFHKTTCSTSRNVLDALRKGKVEPEIRDYISNPPDAEELKGILKKLKLPAEALVRKLCIRKSMREKSCRKAHGLKFYAKIPF